MYQITYRGLPSLHDELPTLAAVRARVARQVRAMNGRPLVGRVTKDGYLLYTFASTRGRPARFTREGM